MRMRKVSLIEVKRSFVVADALKILFNSKGEYSEEELSMEFKGIYERIMRMSEEELDYRIMKGKIKEGARIDIYKEYDWYFGHVPLKKAGVYPQAQNLPVHVTSGSVEDSAEAMKNPENFSIVSPVFMEKLSFIAKRYRFFMENLPLIVLPGGRIREPANKHYFKKGFGENVFKVLKYDVDDGCSRAIAYSLAGLKKVPAYVAKKR